MTLPHLNRRTHLYLGLFLTPWVLMYGVSSIPFSHGDYFEQRDQARRLPMWTKTFEGSYDLGTIPETGPLNPLGARVVHDFHMEDSSYGVYRQGPKQLNIYVHTFWKSTQFKYFIDERRLVAEDMRFRWDHFLTGMHGRGGFEDERMFPLAWAVVVDLVCLSFLIWVVSGLYMWWTLPGLRKWGWVAVLGGVVSFAWFLARL
ncbi:MAG TPA: hypothetical protein VGK29_08560 [Paludibaculum sp.]|jgi:hypothetical protein